MRRLIVCADGTWNSPDQELEEFDLRKPSNVVKLARAIRPVDSSGTSQIVYYDTGVGTHNFVDKLVGGATGVGLSENVIAAYRFLVNNYVDDDEVYLFGFSRGAYTARSLGGLLHKIGLLPKPQEYWLPEGYDLYREDAPKQKLDRYKRLNKSRSIKVKMIGVWDTVGALGIPVGILSGIGRQKYQFHDVSLPGIVENAFHALAVDEQRVDFAPSVWSQKNASQVLDQQWFPGVHTNIGGGYADNGIANHALLWMISKAVNLGLEVDDKYLSHYVPDHKGEIYQSRKSFYRLKKPYVRPIGSGLNESLHESTVSRLSDDSSYKPSNVTKFMKTGGA